MSAQTYWERRKNGRASRRRFLVGAGFAGVAAAAAACSGGSGRKNAGGANSSSSVLSYPEDTTSSAEPGGVFKAVSHIDAPTFDVIAAGSTIVNTLIAAYTYPRLLKFTTAKYPPRLRAKSRAMPPSPMSSAPITSRSSSAFGPAFVGTPGLRRADGPSTPRTSSSAGPSSRR